ncbi:hypothetical protein TWF481_009235 [Arthrobotrys musiformis]|uniref:Uncharacterized protein n=1 Tax=Arthrobotrys musiformis TaxID=47236 RepID=A0AAV9W4W3_9PEZI
MGWLVGYREIDPSIPTSKPSRQFAVQSTLKPSARNTPANATTPTIEVWDETFPVDVATLFIEIHRILGIDSSEVKTRTPLCGTPSILLVQNREP